MTPALPDPVASAALLVGSSSYRDVRLSALPGVANNAADLCAILTDHASWGLPAERSRVLLDCPDPGELIESLDRSARLARDTFLFYYSGHGLVTTEGELVLPTKSTNLDLHKHTGLPFSHVRDIMARCRAERRVVILDCCFSGRALYAMSDPAATVIGQLDAEGTFVMTSASANSASIAPEGARNTAFTGGLLDILRDGIPGVGEWLSLDELYDHTLTAMVRRGWPRPQRLGTNTIGRFRFLRNRAWRKIFSPVPIRTKPEPPGNAADPESAVNLAAYRQWADGVRGAVAAVTPALGTADRDGLTLLDGSYPPDPGDGVSSDCEQAGISLVRETMLAMRAQYGDGATTAAVILGVLADGLHSLLVAGYSPQRLEAEVSACAASLSTWMELSGASACPVGLATGDSQLRAAVKTALGRHEAAESVVAAAIAVGARNVGIIAKETSPGTAQESTFVLETALLAPNGTAVPIALEEPLIVVSTDGEIDARTLIQQARAVPSPLLIIAPRISIYAMRSLLHGFRTVVVVRPASPGFDLIALRDRVTQDGGKWCRARRALVHAEATTIERARTDLELDRSRLTVAVADLESLTIAARALAIVRSAADAGVVSGGGLLLEAAAAQADPVSPGGVVDALVRAAAHEPRKQLRADAPSGTEPVDALATVRGALMHAAATARRYLQVGTS